MFAPDSFRSPAASTGLPGTGKWAWLLCGPHTPLTTPTLLFLQPPVIPVEQYHPSTFMYVVLSCVCVLCLMSLLLLLCLGNARDLTNNIKINLFLSLLLLTLTFLVGIDRTEMRVSPPSPN